MLSQPAEEQQQTSTYQQGTFSYETERWSCCDGHWRCVCSPRPPNLTPLAITVRPERPSVPASAASVPAPTALPYEAAYQAGFAAGVRFGQENPVPWTEDEIEAYRRRTSGY
jgi:hypothetical protein